MTGRSQLATACALLNERGARYVLVGGFAVQLWGSARATKDIDILIEPTAENAQRVLDAIVQLTGSWGLARNLLAEEVARKPVTILGDIPRIDILTVAHRVRYAEAAPDAVVFAVDGVNIPTASIEHLIASKQTGRLRDAVDVEELLDIRRERSA